MAGKVVGAKYRDHAVRAMAQHCRVVRLRCAALSGALMKSANRDIDLADHRRHFGGGFPKRLAGFESDGVGERGLVFAEKARKFFDGRDPSLDVQVGPRRKGRTGCADGGVYSRCRCGMTPPHRLLRDGILCGKLLAVTGHPLAADKMLIHDHGDLKTLMSITH